MCPFFTSVAATYNEDKDMIQAGRLRHRIALQRYTEGGRDENGIRMPGSWDTITPLWASIEGINGREFIAASAEQAATTWRIRTRYIRVDPNMRLKYGDTIFNIKAVLPDNNKFAIVLMCESGVNEG